MNRRMPTPADEAAFAALLDDLLECPADRRAHWLAARTDLDADTQARLARLLRAQAWASRRRLFETLPRLDAAAMSPSEPALAPGCSVGPFVLERELGRGGMGAVWLARYADGRLQRRVALKLPHAAQPALAARFERERDALAALEHPHIARLYDAGVDAASGQLFLAMEAVDGESIDRWCDARALSLAARLGLFIQVVDAVHFAHRALVVHRDLKPGNILVDAQGQVRLLDFGIAKLLEPGRDDGAALTETVGPALTPAYAAPEQFSGGAITTATDVHALGVLLFQLLTGGLPHQPKRGTRAALEEAVLEGDVRAPSRSAISAAAAHARASTPQRLRRALTGDLDTIVLKALQREPAQRYASADAMAQDLRRHLEGRPIAAMPDRWTYRLSKFVRRHRVGVGVGVATGTVVIAAVAVTAQQVLATAEQRLQTAAVTSFLADVLAESEPSERAGSGVVTGKAMVDAGVARAERDFADRPVLRAELLTELGRLYRRHGDIDAARATFERALATLRSAEVPATHVGLNKARARLAEVLSRLGDTVPAQSLADAAVSGCAARSADCAKVRGYAHLVRATTAHDRGDLAGAVDAARFALEEHRGAYGERTAETADAWESLALALRNDGRLDEALASMQQASTIAADENLRVTRRRRLRASAALLLVDTGRYGEAIAHYEALLGEAPVSEGADDSAAQMRMLFASALGHQGLAGRAWGEAMRALTAAAQEGEAEVRAWSWQQQARAASLLGRHEQAVELMRQVLAHFESTTSPPSALREVPRRQLGEALARAGRLSESASVLEFNLGQLQQLYPAGHLQLAQTQDLLGAVARARGDITQALRLHAAARPTLEARLGASHPAVLRTKLYQALAVVAEHGDDERRAAALAAARAYAAHYPTDSAWRRIAEQVSQRVQGEPRSAPDRFTEVVLAH